MERIRRIELPGGASVSAIETVPRSTHTGWLLAYAPGAGSNVHDPFGAYACRELAGRGLAALRFQFPYMEAGRRAPDRTAVLEATWLAVIEAAQAARGRLVVGGRSMGGRIASQVVARGARVDALALFAYPLHPPGRPELRRDEHLAAINAPTLFCSGTRDAFASPEELRAAAGNVPQAHVHLLADADHGFSVPKSSGRSRQDVWAEAVQALVDWLRPDR